MKSFQRFTLSSLALILTASQLLAQQFTVLHNFTNSPDGKYPEAGLFLSGNTLYGTTYHGGDSDNGTIFKINTDGGGYTVLYNFSAFGSFSTNIDGANPQAKLILGGNTLYGTASHGGYVIGVSSVSGNGTVFSVNTNGTNFSVLTYIPSSQPYPEAGLVLNGNTLYGTTYGVDSSFGMAFAVNTNRTSFTNLISFEGKRPQASLALGSNTLYGTTFGGGGTDYGSVFAINTDGTGFTNLIVFNNQSATNGGQPMADLVLSGNTLYGTTSGGSGGGTIFKINTDGTGFNILKAFVNNGNAPDGSAPVAGLVLSGSTLYGTTKWGGSGGAGTVFRINTDGTGYSVLKNFTSTDGANPLADLVLGGNTLYGTTQLGGSSGFGVVFSLTLPPPSLQITNANNLPIVLWVDDGMSHVLQTTTNLLAGDWSSIPVLNWTNNANGTLQIGYQIISPIVSPAAYFRLQ